jgi:hypothetical protein
VKYEVVYVNSRDANLRFVKEAQKSATRLRQFIPDAAYTLVTNAPSVEYAPFDRVVEASFDIPEVLEKSVHKNGQMVAKLNYLAALAADRVLYVGSDTYALGPGAADLFPLLDRFDLVAAHAPHRINTSIGNSALPAIPTSFPEFNCDLILLRRSPEVSAFLEQWRDLYITNALGHPHDQGAFRQLAYFSDLRIATLPPEYNYRGHRRYPVVVLQNRRLLPRYMRRERFRSHPAYRSIQAAERLARGSYKRVRNGIRQ